MRALLPILLVGLTSACYRPSDYPQDAGSVIILNPLPGSAPADGATRTAITAVIPQAIHNPNSGAAVTFTTTLGTLVPTTAVPVDGNGTATVFLQSPSLTGTASVVATLTVGGATYPVSTLLPFTVALPQEIQVVPKQENLPGKLAANLVVSIQTIRSVGIATPGQWLTATAADHQGNPLGAFTAAHVLSDANGLASTVYTAGDTAYRGPLVITVSADGTAIVGTATIQISD